MLILLACLKPLLALSLPFLLAWLLVALAPTAARKPLRFVALLAAGQVACLALLPPLLLTAQALIPRSSQTTLSVADRTAKTVSGLTASGLTVSGLTTSGAAIAPIYRQPRVTQSALHGYEGFQGVDVVGDGDPTIYAPFDGRVKSVGCDGLPQSRAKKSHPVCGRQATWLELESADGRYRLVLLHGDYTVTAGQTIRQGQPLGADNCWGWCTGNHSHIILWDRGVLVSYLDYVGKAPAATPARDLGALAEALAGLGYAPTGDVGLRISHYNPAAGGINCDHDCSTMASGDRTWSWTGGKNGVYAAACPPAWPFGARFTTGGATYECRDRGGWIQCYQPGQTDKAIANAHSKGYLLDQPAVAATAYCWVDLYNAPPVGYGTLSYDWRFVR